MPQTTQLFRHKKVPPKIDSANFSDNKYLQCGLSSFHFTKLTVLF